MMELKEYPFSKKYGWCEDHFGVSWQIIPENIDELLATSEAMEAMMQMKKLDIEKLKRI